MGWMYWLPKTLLPHIWYRVAVPGEHPELQVEKYTAEALGEATS